MYSCPECSQLFARRWNMRDHCRSQHGYDPDPIVGPRPQSLVVKNFLGKINERKRLEEENELSGMKEEEIISIDGGLNYLLNNFIFVNKRSVSGISAFFCTNCLSFSFKYVGHLGHEFTSGEEHVCQDEKIRKVNGLQDRIEKKVEMRTKSNKSLLNLVDSLFSEKKFNVVKVMERNILEYHAPRINIPEITPGHWTSTIIEKRENANEKDWKEFVNEVWGTYAVIEVKTGSFSGNYVVDMRVPI